MRRRSTYKWTYCGVARYFKLNLMTFVSAYSTDLISLNIKEWETPQSLGSFLYLDQQGVVYEFYFLRSGLTLNVEAKVQKQIILD